MISLGVVSLGVAVMNKLQARSVAIASSLLGEIAIRIVARWDLAMDLARPPLGVEQTFVADGDDGEYVYMGGRPGAWGRARGCVSVSLWCAVLRRTGLRAGKPAKRAAATPDRSTVEWSFEKI